MGDLPAALKADEFKKGGGKGKPAAKGKLQQAADGKWIQGADIKKGAFTAKAKAAGMGVQEFASHVLANESKYDAHTIRQANLAQTFNKMHKAEEGLVVTSRDLIEMGYEDFGAE